MFILKQNAFKKAQCDWTTMSFKCNRTKNCIWPFFFLCHLTPYLSYLWTKSGNADGNFKQGLHHSWHVIYIQTALFLIHVTGSHKRCLNGEFLRHFKENKYPKVQGYRESWPPLTFQWFTFQNAIGYETPL